MTPENHVVQGLWVEGRLSLNEQLCIRSFLAHGHAFHLYAYGPLDGVPPGTTLRDAREILPETRIFRYQEGFGKGSLAGFSDLFRLHLLHQRGGWWVDLDVVCLRPFDLAAEHVIATEWSPENPDRLTNCVLRMPAGSALAAACLAAFDEIDLAQAAFAETGPALVQRVCRATGYDQYAVPYWTFCPIGWQDASRLVAPRFRLSLDPLKRWIRRRPQVRVHRRSYAVHLWNEMWSQHGLRKDRSYPPSSVVERLKRQYGLSA